MILSEIGITHRDIKPDNFIYSLETNNLKLSDFGLSEFFDKPEGQFSLCGTPRYLN